MQRRRRAIAITLTSITTISIAGWAWNAARQPSDLVKIVEDDSSWLTYLPADEPTPKSSVVGMNHLHNGSSTARRIDWIVGSETKTMSLCFAESKELTASLCPGFRYLGESRRPEMELRAIAALGGTAEIDWVALLSGPSPSTADIGYLG